jgi:hypothetical protein
MHKFEIRYIHVYLSYMYVHRQHTHITSCMLRSMHKLWIRYIHVFLMPICIHKDLHNIHTNYISNDEKYAQVVVEIHLCTYVHIDANIT